MITEAKLKETGLWRVQVFGALEVQKPTGEQISLNGRKAGELLAYLALNPHQAHSRLKLTAMLWADTEVGNERTRLRQEIAFIRSLFPTDGESNPLVHISQAELHIDPEVRIDAVQFLNLIDIAKKESNAAVIAQLLEEALGLYKAELLEEYDSAWIVTERERLCQIHEQALFDLAEAYHQQRNFESQEQTLRRILSHNPLNEECHIALMRIFADLGQPTRVQQQYTALERILRDELGAGLSRRTA